MCSLRYGAKASAEDVRIFMNMNINMNNSRTAITVFTTTSSTQFVCLHSFALLTQPRCESLKINRLRKDANTISSSVRRICS